MRIVVVGGTGLVGSKVVHALRKHGHDAIVASPDTGVNTITGDGVDEILKGASVVIDVSNSPSFADDEVLKFFRTSTRNLLAAEEAAGVGHHVALSVVGCERLPNSGYFRAKIARKADQSIVGPLLDSAVHAIVPLDRAQRDRPGSSTGDTLLPSRHPGALGRCRLQTRRAPVSTRRLTPVAYSLRQPRRQDG